MGLHLLLADHRDLARQDLHTLFASNPAVDTVDEVDTREALHQYLATHQQIDLVIIHQRLIKDFTLLPNGHIVVLADTLDQAKLFTAFDKGAKGYLLENPPCELLLATLKLVQQEGASTFLLDPSIIPTLLGPARNSMFSSTNIDMLTSREREVFLCLRKGLTDAKIATELCISQTTVRTHIAKIVHKLHMTREQIKHMPLPDDGA